MIVAVVIVAAAVQSNNASLTSFLPFPPLPPVLPFLPLPPVLPSLPPQRRRASSRPPTESRRALRRRGARARGRARESSDHSSPLLSRFLPSPRSRYAG